MRELSILLAALNIIRINISYRYSSSYGYVTVLVIRDYAATMDV